MDNKKLGIILGGTVIGLGLFCVYDYVKTCREIDKMVDEVNEEIEETERLADEVAKNIGGTSKDLDELLKHQEEINKKLNDFADKFNKANYEEKQEAVILHFKETRK